MFLLRCGNRGAKEKKERGRGHKEKKKNFWLSCQALKRKNQRKDECDGGLRKKMARTQAAHPPGPSTEKGKSSCGVDKKGDGCLRIHPNSDWGKGISP